MVGGRWFGAPVSREFERNTARWWPNAPARRQKPSCGLRWQPRDGLCRGAPMLCHRGQTVPRVARVRRSAVPGGRTTLNMYRETMLPRIEAIHILQLKRVSGNFTARSGMGQIATKNLFVSNFYACGTRFASTPGMVSNRVEACHRGRSDLSARAGNRG